MRFQFIVVLLVAVCIGCSRCDLEAVPDILSGDSADCSCAYHRGGCVISVAAPVGFKCKCSYKGAWTCAGTAFPCVGEEMCPGNMADYCACKLGEGDCGGYRNPVTVCEGSGRLRIGVDGLATCDCQYHRGGCTIFQPAPFGWKCVCTYKGFWTCNAWAQQCAAHEVCLGEDFSYCGCQQGRGNCGGYPDRDICPSPFVSASCNCNRAADWNRGFYVIEKVTYDSDNMKIHELQPIVLAEKEIPNFSSENQSITLEVGEKLFQTSSFSHTGGIEIESGLNFKVGIPLVALARVSFSISESYSHTFGKSDTFETSYEGSFTCTGSPETHTKCFVTMQTGRVTVPYIMTVKHKIIPNCACESYGVWTGVQAYDAKLESIEVET